MRGLLRTRLDLVHGCTYVTKPKEGRERRILKTILTTEVAEVHRENIFFAKKPPCTSATSVVQFF
jgi:hypothetical protein